MAKQPRGQVIYVKPEEAYKRLVYGGDGDAGDQATTFTVPSGSRPGRMYQIVVSWVTTEAGCPCEGTSYNYDVKPVYEHDPECFAPTHKSKANWTEYATEIEREYVRVYGKRLGPSILRHPNGLCCHLKLVQKCLKRRRPEPDSPTYFALFQAFASARVAILKEMPDYTPKGD